VSFFYYIQKNSRCQQVYYFGLDIIDAKVRLLFAIVQTNTVHRTGSNQWHRLAFRPTFSGTVQKGKEYIIIDDVFAAGGTFAELKSYIESNGGKVVDFVTFGTGRNDPQIAMTEKTRLDLERRRIVFTEVYHEQGDED